MQNNYVKEALDCKESLSGLIIRAGSRVIKSEDFMIAMKGKEYIPVENIDEVIDKGAS